MTYYKLAPFEPTPEMVSAAEDAYMPFGDMDLALRMAILAAPDVQGEAVAYQIREKGSDNWHAIGASHYQYITSRKHEWSHAEVRRLYAAPQPVEQKPAPGVDVLVEALESALGSFDDWCEGQDPSDIADAIDAFPWVMQARTALAAHRKQEPSHDNQ